MSFILRPCLAFVLICAFASRAPAVSVVLSGIIDGGTGTTFDAGDNDPNTGADDLPSYSKIFPFSDPNTGVTFDVELLLTAGGGFLEAANSGHMGIATTVGEGGATRAIDRAGESITYSINSITQTGGPSTTINFNGFTSINIRFAEGPADAGRITDGSSTLFAFDNSDGVAEVTNASGSPFTVNTAGMPSTLVAEWVAGFDPNIEANAWRVNSVAAEFSFDADILVLGDTDGDGIVEPATVGDLGDDLGPIVNFFFTNQTDRINGDLVDDDFIDFLDFREWKDNVPGGVSESVLEYIHSVISVPEPTSGLLSLFGLLVLSSRRAAHGVRGRSLSPVKGVARQ